MLELTVRRHCSYGSCVETLNNFDQFELYSVISRASVKHFKNSECMLWGRKKIPLILPLYLTQGWS